MISGWGAAREGPSGKCACAFELHVPPMFTRALASMAAQASAFRIALVQLAVGSDKATNLSRATEKVREASKNGAKFVTLPVSSGKTLTEYYLHFHCL